MKTAAFTGKGENPFGGNLEEALAFDRYNNDARVIHRSEENFKNKTQELGIYTAGARTLVSYVRNFGNALDIGSGTGISTLELAKKVNTHMPGEFLRNFSVDGVEIKPAMVWLARHKFHHDDLGLSENDQKMLDSFMRESAVYKDNVSFYVGDIENIILPENHYSTAIANQVMHWLGIEKAFSNIQKGLTENGEVIWNSASHWFRDEQFPAEEYGFRYNDFMGYVMDEVSKEVDVRDYKQLSRPDFGIEDVKAMTHGFYTKQEDTLLLNVDFKTFLKNHVPRFVKELSMQDEGIEEITDYAISEALKKPGALDDNKHMYDIVPIFRSVKAYEGN